MLYNGFQLAMLATEDRVRAIRSRKTLSDSGVKRVFRLGGDREPVRQVGRR